MRLMKTGFVKTAAVWCAMIGGGVWGVGGSSALEVGEAAHFAARTTDGQARTADDYAGKLLVMHFWASWHTPSVAQLDTLRAIAEHTADRGVALLGVCLDDLSQSEDAARQVIAQSATHGSWDHMFAQTQMPPMDTRFFAGPYEIPACWVVSPTGEALWVGHPGELPEALAGFLVSHAPDVPEPVAETGDETAVAEGDAPGEPGGPEEPAPASGASAEMISAARAALLEAETAYETDPPDFAQVLSAIKGIDALAVSDPLIAAHGQRWKRRLDAAQPDALAGLVAARDADVASALSLDHFLMATAGVDPLDGREAAGSERLAIKLKGARRNAERGRHLQAYGDYKWIADVAAGAPDADEALIRVLRYEADEELMAELAAAAAEREAQAELFMAKGYANNFKEDEAIKILHELITAYPDSKAAVDAQTLLEKLK